MIGQPKIILGAACLAFVSLVTTYLHLTPGTPSDNLIAVAGYQSVASKALPTVPSGNIFNVDRVIRSQEKEPVPDEQAKQTKAQTKQADDFVMVSIVTQGKHTYAVFVGHDQRIALSQGEFNPSIGRLDSIMGNRSTTTDLSGAEKQWQLFPVGDVAPQEELPNQEEITP
ncbi:MULTISPECIES: hypothetical protein [Vibrio]|uniref:hypothetical protein n=1 Tax=Vibrio TaxID=662 RepID=UPI00064616A6|nr:MULTISPECIES: hypothetical protein [Vibrio]MBY7668170.1 hypothetical protein [Vibrio anguillarum]NAX45371.1 hypothetical protein [Vibrio sp. V25_P4S6T154]OXX47690.1 hypothetical protein B9J93_06285 [Vibrio sp. V17_P4S1T151]OXX61421.1 hypothetical protein B9J89_14845 [Vibrio sp. V15_P4S5T153]OXX67055.1 hypothetical protein B9J94_11585 [Vibrio sp. V20_P4S3T152]